jgi:hypothetical protein
MVMARSARASRLQMMIRSPMIAARSPLLAARPPLLARRLLCSDSLTPRNGVVLGIRRSRLWSDMPRDVQRHWEDLGWSESPWSGNSPPPSSVDVDWDALSSRQLAAAKKLGYNFDRWENDPEDPFEALEADARRGRSLVPLPQEIVAMKACQWHELGPVQQLHWRRLGWTQERWDGWEAAPASAYTSWSALGPPQQDAAKSLGYNEETWDADDDASSGSSGGGSGDGSGGGGSTGKFAESNALAAKTEIGNDVRGVLTFIAALCGGIALWSACGVVDARAQKAAADGSGGGTTTHLSRQVGAAPPLTPSVPHHACTPPFACHARWEPPRHSHPLFTPSLFTPSLFIPCMHPSIRTTHHTSLHTRHSHPPVPHA